MDHDLIIKGFYEVANQLTASVEVFESKLTVTKDDCVMTVYLPSLAIAAAYGAEYLNAVEIMFSYNHDHQLPEDELKKLEEGFKKYDSEESAEQTGFYRDANIPDTTSVWSRRFMKAPESEEAIPNFARDAVSLFNDGNKVIKDIIASF